MNNLLILDSTTQPRTTLVPKDTGRRCQVIRMPSPQNKQPDGPDDEPAACALAA